MGNEKKDKIKVLNFFADFVKNVVALLRIFTRALKYVVDCYWMS
jgi:hypothetical protein